MTILTNNVNQYVNTVVASLSLANEWVPLSTIGFSTGFETVARD